MSNSKKEQKTQCFVLMPISNQNGYLDNHFNLVYEDIIKPAIENNNMQPMRADETKNTNLIQLDILRKIIETPLAVCDMSAKNPNVFYELGMRQAFDMPTVLLIDNNTTAPFDVSGLRYVTYNKDMKHRDVIQTIKELSDNIKETYQQKDNKSEINSLIRLMELASPATLNQIDISDKEKIERLQELELFDIKASIHDLNNIQNQILLTLNQMKHNDNNYRKISNLDEMYIYGSNKIEKQKMDKYDKFMRNNGIKINLDKSR